MIVQSPFPPPEGPLGVGSAPRAWRLGFEASFSQEGMLAVAAGWAKGEIHVRLSAGVP